MNTATTRSRMLLYAGALSLCLMGGTPFVYAESNGTNGAGDGLSNGEARHIYVAERNQLWTDVAEGDDMGNHYQTWSERPMSVPDSPETAQESPEFQGYESGA